MISDYLILKKQLLLEPIHETGSLVNSKSHGDFYTYHPPLAPRSISNFYILVDCPSPNHVLTLTILQDALQEIVSVSLNFKHPSSKLHIQMAIRKRRNAVELSHASKTSANRVRIQSRATYQVPVPFLARSKPPDTISSPLILYQRPTSGLMVFSPMILSRYDSEGPNPPSHLACRRKVPW